ncbi:hypothetical protein DR91_2050 [Neisseria lactamica ATCC 23970]|nr:hypothetical protein DR91_2050 [Neisseria lactamica ATCC 23970]
MNQVMLRDLVIGVNKNGNLELSVLPYPISCYQK